MDRPGTAAVPPRASSRSTTWWRGRARPRSRSACPPGTRAATIGGIVAAIRRPLVEDRPLVDEIIVVDDRSSDDTAAAAAAAGAGSSRPPTCFGDVRAGHGQGRGALEAAWRASTGDLVVWCDADITDFDTRFIVGLVGPAARRPDGAVRQGLLRATRRPHAPGTGGRTTELVARPVISLLFPSLTRIVQPLSGEYAARRTVLERVPFVQGYGVDLGLLIDIEERCGAAAHRPGRPRSPGTIATAPWTSSRPRRSRSCRRPSPAPGCRPAARPSCGGPACRPSRAPTSSGRRWPTCARRAGGEPAPDRRHRS